MKMYFYILIVIIHYLMHIQAKPLDDEATSSYVHPDSLTKTAIEATKNKLWLASNAGQMSIKTFSKYLSKGDSTKYENILDEIGANGDIEINIDGLISSVAEIMLVRQEILNEYSDKCVDGYINQSDALEAIKKCGFTDDNIISQMINEVGSDWLDEKGIEFKKLMIQVITM
ncbi:uncharacterized protein LOC126904349 [Daktulosphaira vitifoliae]|uniref:uncharacterized protein LOC126904349 n=1 Tax=Daktulosphaira vitifoliae TaxID=58002 RepID=UPI0021AAA1FE|nr:uncharacterized protein LOC126904349 [Daktulosphaira vitifoliae]